eukprot:scaffold12.g8291.t1
MFSLGEVVLIVVAGAWVFGPQDLPRIARVVGSLTGRATGTLYRARARLFQFAEDTEVTKLHQEVQATMYQLNAIRDELRGGINLMSPGPLAQRVLKIAPLAGQASADAWQHAQQPQAGQEPWVPPRAWAQPPAAGPGPPSGTGAAAQAPSFAAAPLLRAAPQAAPPAATAAPAASGQQQDGARGQGTDEGPHPAQIPVSAVAAGLAPDRSAGMPSGSEVALDALMEELVARQALAFVQQQQQQEHARQPEQQQQQQARQLEQAVQQGQAPQPEQAVQQGQARQPEQAVQQGQGAAGAGAV